MRKPNHADAELLIKLYEMRREPELRKARAWFGSQEFTSPDEVAAIYGTGSDEDRWLRMQVTYWDMVAALVNHGVLHEELFFDTNGEDIFVWKKVEPWIGAVRAKMRPTYLHNLESCATRHAAWRQKGIDEFTRKAAGAGKARAKSGKSKKRR